jgi:hypothetical protein
VNPQVSAEASFHFFQMQAIWLEIVLILAALPELTTCSEAEVRLDPVVSNFNGFTVSPMGKVLEPDSRGVGDSSWEVSMVVPKTLAMVPELVSLIAVASIGLFDVPIDDFALAIVSPVSRQS